MVEKFVVANFETVYDAGGAEPARGSFYQRALRVYNPAAPFLKETINFNILKAAKITEIFRGNMASNCAKN